jgi:uncharacterized protein (DUF1501 family)
MAAEVSRRRFLQLLGMTGVASLVPFPELVANAAPLLPGDTVLVSLFLSGGLDGAHLLVPTGPAYYGHYVDRRGALAVDAAKTLPVGSEHGLHPSMRRLHARHRTGRVAFVRGVDLLGAYGFDTLSHFAKTDYVMAGRTAPSGATRGVWARWADAEPTNPLLLASVSPGLPVLFAGGSKLQATSLPPYLGNALGTVAVSRQEDALVDALRALRSGYASDTTLAGELARNAARATELAEQLARAYPRATSGESLIQRSLRVVASLINANLTGTRVYSVTHSGYDTHANQRLQLEQALLPDLDLALQTFFDTLARPANVVVLVWSEFGRRAAANATGTDHGTANDVILIGERVVGGVYGAQPSFESSRLDANGNLVGSTPFGSIYTELIERLLGGDAASVLGAPYPRVGCLS